MRSWTEDGFDHDGAAYTLKGQTALPRPVQQPHPRLVLGGSVKSRFADLAVRYAAEVKPRRDGTTSCGRGRNGSTVRAPRRDATRPRSGSR